MSCFLVNTCGMFGSASTWLFNITAGILQSANPDKRVEQVYTDDANEDVFRKRDAFDIMVVKSHFADPVIAHLNRHGVVPSIITLVDPRKSVQSSMNRFGMPFERAVGEVVRNIENIGELLRNARILTFRYENDFFLRRETVGEVARFLGVALDDAEWNAIFERFTKKKVKQFIDRFERLEQERIRTMHFTATFSDDVDQVTQFHAKHFSDTSQTPLEAFFREEQLAELNMLFGEFMRDTGYAVRTSAWTPS